MQRAVIGRLDNARLSFEGQEAAAGQAIVVGHGGGRRTYAIERVAPGEIVADLVFIDGCGAWVTVIRTDADAV
jgi:hypothetical protein